MSEFKAKITAELDMGQVQAQLDALTKGKKIKIDVDSGQGKSSIDGINSSLKNAQQTSQSLGDTLKQALGIGSSFAIAQRGVLAVEQAAKKAGEAIKSFDKDITNVRIATNQSYDSARQLVSSYNAMGKTLGATTSEVSDSAVTWLRQGKSIQESNKLIKDSMMLSKVGMIDSAKSATLLTSAMKGYNVSVKDSTSIVDKLTSIDMHAAVNSGDLAEAMSRTAKTANSAGVSMDKLLGYLATVGEVTQKDMSSIGNAFKTIFTRMNDIKGGKLQLLDEDGTTELLSDVEQTLKNVGIDLRSSMNEFNNSGDVLDALAAKWDTLSSVQQAALTKAFAGTRQGENFRVLMENYDNAKKYMDIAANSAGTAEQKFSAYTDSIEAKSKSMQAAFESLAVNTFSTNLMGGLIDAGTALISFTDKTNILKGALAGITVVGITSGLSALVKTVSDAAIGFNNFNSALQLLKSGSIGSSEIQALATATAGLSTSQMQAVLASEALSTSQRMAILTAQGFSEAEAAATLSSMGLVAAEEGAATATFSLAGAFQGLWATLAANPMILVAAGVAATVAAFSAYNQSVETARMAAQDAATSFDTNTTSLEEQISKIGELRSQIASGTLTDQEAMQAKQQLIDIQNELVSTYGEQAQGIDLVNGSLEKQNEIINNIIKSDANKFLNENAKAISQAEKKLKGQIGQQKSFFGDGGWNLGQINDFAPQSKQVREILNKYKDNISLEYKEGLDNGVFNVKFHGDASQAKQVLNDLMTDIRNADSEIQKSDAAKSIMSGAESGLKEANDIIDKYSDIYEQAEKARMIVDETLFSPKGSQDKKTASKWISEYADAVKELNEAIAFGDADAITQAQHKYDALGESIHSMLNDDSGFSKYADNISNIESQLTTAAETAIEFSESLQGIGLQKAQDVTTQFKTGLSNIQEIISSQGTGQSISFEDYGSDELKDYTSALEYHNGVLQYNAEKVKEIAKAKAEEAKETIAANKAQEQSKYLENARQIQNLREQLDSAKGSEKLTLQDTIASLLAENSQIVATCNQYDLMTSAINEATSAYQNWLNAQNAAQRGDMFDSSLSAMMKIKDTLSNSDSDDYGRIGNEDYKAAVDFVVPDTIDHEDQNAVSSYMDSIKGYLTFDDNGNADGLNIGEFCQKSVDAGLMVFDEASGEYQIAGQKTMQDFADGLGLSLPMVQAMFGEMEEFGGHFDWADEVPMTFQDLAVHANEAAESLRQIEGNENMKIVLDVSEFEDKQTAIQTLDNTIQQMNDIKASPNVDTSQIENANAVIQYCVAQKQVLSEPAVMSVDASQVQGEIGNAISLLQEFQTVQNTIEMQASVGADTSEAESQLSSLTSEIQGLSAEVKATLNIDTSSADTITASLAGLSPEIMVSAGIDSSLIDGYTPPDKEATAKFNVDSSAPDSYQPADKSATVTYGVNSSAVDGYHPPNKSATVTYHIVTVGSPPSGGSGHVNGTAHAFGTAYASGNWGTAPGGKTLLGELGQEIVVDPHSGIWYTVGDNGAEIRDIPKNAIVFNHLQTKSLLSNGYAVGRATAMARGTALVSGGIRVPQKSSSSSSSSGGGSHSSGGSSSGGSSGGGRSSGGSGGSSGGGSTAKAKSADSKSDFIDWVEIKLKRIENEIKAIDKAAKDATSSWGSRNQSLASQMSKVTSEIDLQTEAYKRYMAQANVVPLAQDLRDRVANGTIDINEYGEDTRKNIEQYKKWYENAIKCQDAIRDLKLELKDLYSQQFKNLVTQWEDAVQVLEQSADKLKSLMSRREEFASDYVQMSLSRDASNANIKSYLALINNLSDQRSKRKSELAKLTDKLASGTTKGIIAKGSEEYYKLLKDIQEVEDEINDLNEDIIKVSNSISKEYVKVFNSIYDEYKNKLSLSEHLSKEYNNYLDIAEAKGLKTSSVYYSKLKSIAENNAKNASQLAKDLQKQLTKAVGTGEIRRGSEAWYEMTERINDAVEAEQEAIEKAQEYANKVREIKWDKFDYLQDTISAIREEAEFLIDLFEDSVIFDDNGAINDNGKAILGLHAMNYDVAMNQADRYANEIISLNKEIANDNSNSDLLERRKELLKAQRESIKAAEDEKHSIKSLISDGFKKELDYLDDIIEKYKDALDNQKDLYDYQKNIQKQTSEISSLQKQLSAYANDVTEETRAKIQKISVELKEKQDKLEETEYDRMVSDSKKMLDNFYDDYQEALNKRLDNIDALIENVIDSSNENASSISETIKEKADSVGLTLSSELKDIWDGSLDTVLNVYGDRHLSALTTINQTILSVRDAVYGLWQQSDAVAKSDSSAIGTESSNKKKQEANAAKKAKSTKAKASNASKATTSIGDIMKTSEKKYQTELAKQNSQKQFAKYGDWAYVYDYNFYRSHNKDLQQAFGNDEEKYFEHFKQYGMKEGRQGNALFNVHYYKNQYKDLQKAFGNNLAEYYKHFMSYGINEGRSPNKNFNFNKYKSNNKDVAKAFGKNTREYYKHWLQYGQHENRKSYATGAKRVGTTGYAWTQEGANEVYLRASDHAVLTRVGADDRIYNAMASENLWQAANNPANFIANNLSGLNTSSIGGIHNGAKVEQNFDNISFVMPNVRNYNELVSQMQQDKNFEKLIQAMTLGQLNGKSSDMKYRLRFK